MSESTAVGLLHDWVHWFETERSAFMAPIGMTRLFLAQQEEEEAEREQQYTEFDWDAYNETRVLEDRGLL